MKVIGKFAAAFFVVSCLGLLLLGYVNARDEAAQLAETTRDDLRALGAGLRAGVETTWLAHGEDEALKIVHAAQAEHADVDVVWMAGPPAAPQSAEGMVTIAVPVRVGGDAAGSIRLRRAVLDERAAFRRALGAELRLAAALAVVAGILAVALGGALIGRPLQRVVDQARRIGAGDFTRRLEASRRDEIGDLKRELNVMCDRLDEARARVEAESTARVETLEQLRHLDRLRTVGTIASSLAHELGTPLNVLLLRGQSLAAGEMAPEEARDAGETITNQVEKMSRLVRQILDFSRKTPTRGKVQLGEVAAGVVGLLGSLAKKAGVVLTVELDRDSTVLGEAAELEQALTNLTLNAIQAMPSGGALRLRVGVSEAARPSANTSPARAAFVAVEDQGVGIAPEQVDQIFEPFYTTKPAGVGTGLGLGVARGIAEDHGGWISARSELGRGSTFTLHIPPHG